MHEMCIILNVCQSCLAFKNYYPKLLTVTYSLSNFKNQYVWVSLYLTYHQLPMATKSINSGEASTRLDFHFT